MIPRDVALAAYATSSHNEPDAIDEEEGALLELLNAAINGYIIEGSRVNPRYFGTRIETPLASGAWARPDEAIVIERIETEAGAEVIVLPLDQRDREPSRPAIYAWGRNFYPAGRANDPTTTLVLFAATMPAEIEDLDSDVDVGIPDRMAVPLLKWEVAIYLAQRDGDREAEVAAFGEQLVREKARFAAFIEAELLAEVRQYGYGHAFASPTPTPR